MYFVRFYFIISIWVTGIDLLLLLFLPLFLDLSDSVLFVVDVLTVARLAGLDIDLLLLSLV